MKYWDVIPFPSFPEKIRKEIISLYHKRISYPANLTIKNFIVQDNAWNKKVGITELDKSLKLIKEHLNIVLDTIVMNGKIDTQFTFPT